ncbi:MAG: ATPase, T2SS/T4P/T4SS family [Nocardioides sp.]
MGAAGALPIEDSSSGSLPAELAGLLRQIVAARLAFLVTGGTGSGKTTLLASLLSLVPGDERLVIVEDSSELRPEHARRGAGGLPGQHRGCRRDHRAHSRASGAAMRLDRLVVGEVRGAEVVDLPRGAQHRPRGRLRHGASPTRSPTLGPHRALGLVAGCLRAAIHSQLALAVAVVVHLASRRRRRAKVRQVGVPRLGAGTGRDRDSGRGRRPRARCSWAGRRALRAALES